MNKLLLSVSLLIMSVLLFAQNPNKYVLLEEFSTAPCGACTDGAVVAEQVKQNHPNVIVVTHHAGFGTDSMTIPESQTIAAMYTNGAPKAVINRLYYAGGSPFLSGSLLATSRQRWDSICAARLAIPEIVTVNISHGYNPNTRDLSVTVSANFSALPNASLNDLRINLMVVEDSVIGFGPGYDQRNYYNTGSHPMAGRGDTIVGYEHRHVIRKMLDGAFGSDGIIPSVPVLGTTYDTTYTFNLSSRWDESKIDLVAYVGNYDAGGNIQNHDILNAYHQKLSVLPVGVENVEVHNLKLYPNPTQNRFLLDLRSISQANSLEIYALDGSLVKQQILETNQKLPTVSVNDLNSGIYIVKVLGEKAVYQSKLIVTD